VATKRLPGRTAYARLAPHGLARYDSAGESSGGDSMRADERAREAAEVAHLLGVGWRRPRLPTARWRNTLENRSKLCACCGSSVARSHSAYWRRGIPTLDYAALGYEACFLSGLAKWILARTLIALQDRFTQSLC